MNLYLISQGHVRGYDTFDSAVVATDTEEQARYTHPAHYKEGLDEDSGDWPTKQDADKIKVKLLGTAVEGTEAGVICSSFNAG